MAQKDTIGVLTLSEDVVQPALPVSRPRPLPIDDPTWGKTSFAPAPGNVARRASLFDLPDPTESYVDPLATDPSARPIVMPDSDDASDATAPNPPTGEGRSYVRGDREPIGVIRGSTIQGEAPAPRPVVGDGGRQRKRHRFHLFGRKEQEPSQQEDSLSEWLGVDDDYDAKSGGREIGSWDNFRREEEGMGHKGSKWKGGATTRSDLRLVDDEASDIPRDNSQDETARAEGYTLGGYDTDEDGGYVPYDDAYDAPAPTPDPQGFDFGSVPELRYVSNGPRDLDQDDRDRQLREEERAAITSMDDDELLSHDIWFVAVGASGLDHAGAREFLAAHRKDIRGAFVINLDSVGAGELTALTSEGTNPTRKADRRMVRMLTSIAQDLHIPLGHARRDWEDTDATPIMQHSMRAVTLMGLDEDGQPALSHTADDQPEGVNDAQVVDVAELVAEFIRRS